MKVLTSINDRLVPADAHVFAEFEAPSRPLLLFAITIVLSVIYMTRLGSAFLLDGQMWAEMATNYFVNAQGTTLIQRLFSTDAGYIPLPQRLIALVVAVLRLPAAAVPYAYSWAAVVLTAAIVGAFCLRPFRALVRSDAQRFFTVVAVLIVIDFETRTFINFTYVAAFLAAVLTALALVSRTEEVPRWAWCLPVLMMSKPAVLAALPAMVCAASVSRRRFRHVTFAVLILTTVQVVQMAFSHADGTFVSTHAVSLMDRFVAAAKYGVGFLGVYIGGPASARPLILGTLAAACCAGAFFRPHGGVNALLLTGSGLLLFNVVLNCFVLTDMWNLNMARLEGAPVYRHIIVGYMGVVLIVTALFVRLDDGLSRKRGYLAGLGSALFVVWFVMSGWLFRGVQISATPGAPVLDNSSWVPMSPIIDSSEPVCVPINPIGWVYGRDCGLLNPEIGAAFAAGLVFYPADMQGSIATINVPLLPKNTGKRLLSLAVLAKPGEGLSHDVSAKAVIAMKDGGTRVLQGRRRLPGSGGLVLMTAKRDIAFDEIEALKIEVDGVNAFGFVAGRDPAEPALLWMGE